MGYGEIVAIDSTVANMGISFLFRPFLPGPTRIPLTFPQTNPVWRRPPAQGAGAGAPPALTPTRARYQDTKHPGCLGLRISTGYPGDGTWEIWLDASDRDKDPDRGILPQPPGVLCDVLGVAPIQSQEIPRRCRYGDKGMEQRVGYWTHTLPRAKHGKLQIVTVPTRTPLVGAYLPPSTLEHLLDVEEALYKFKGLDPIVLGDLNMDLDNTHRSRSQHMADLLMEFGIVDLVRNFRQRRRFQNLKIWTQGIHGSTLHSRFGDTGGRQRVVIPPGGGRNGIRGTFTHRRVHQETAGNHIGKGGPLPHIWTLRQGGANSGYKTVGEMVGPGRDKWTWELDGDSA